MGLEAITTFPKLSVIFFSERQLSRSCRQLFFFKRQLSRSCRLLFFFKIQLLRICRCFFIRSSIKTDAQCDRASELTPSACPAIQQENVLNILIICNK